MGNEPSASTTTPIPSAPTTTTDSPDGVGSESSEQASGYSASKEGFDEFLAQATSADDAHVDLVDDTSTEPVDVVPTDPAVALPGLIPPVSLDEAVAAPTVDVPDTDSRIRRLEDTNRQLMAMLEKNVGIPTGGNPVIDAPPVPTTDPWDLSVTDISLSKARNQLGDVSESTLQHYADSLVELTKWSQYVDNPDHKEVATREVAKIRSRMRDLHRDARYESHITSLQTRIDTLENKPNLASSAKVNEKRVRDMFVPDTLVRAGYPNLAAMQAAGKLDIDMALSGTEFASLDFDTPGNQTFSILDSRLELLDRAYSKFVATSPSPKDVSSSTEATGLIENPAALVPAPNQRSQGSELQEEYQDSATNRAGFDQFLRQQSAAGNI